MLLMFSRLSGTKTRSVHQIAQSADPAATHQMIRKIQTTVSKPSISKQHLVPQLHLASLLILLVKSASPSKRHRQPRSAHGTLSTLQQTINHKPHIPTARNALAVLALISKSCNIPMLLAAHVRNLVSNTSTDRHSAQRTVSSCSKSLRHVRDLLTFDSSLRCPGPFFPPDSLTSRYTDF